jgi:uncharacterized protein YdhG (YjbR/CyaY superfamily)
VAFGAATNHCAFYPGSRPVEAHKDELKANETSKGTIRFQADSPIPAALVRKLIKTRQLLVNLFHRRSYFQEW